MSAPQSSVQTPGTVNTVTTTRTIVVHFDSNSDEIRASAMQILYGAAQDLRGSKVTSIRVTGHTDGGGRRSYNQKLSERRAAAVAAQLGKLGVHAETQIVVGAGKVKGASRRDRDARRVEIVVERVQDIAAIPHAPTEREGSAAISGGTSADLLTCALPHMCTALMAEATLAVERRAFMPLQSADKQAIKRNLPPDGTTWLPPPTV